MLLHQNRFLFWKLLPSSICCCFRNLFLKIVNYWTSVGWPQMSFTEKRELLGFVAIMYMLCFLISLNFKQLLLRQNRFLFWKLLTSSISCCFRNFFWKLWTIEHLLVGHKCRLLKSVNFLVSLLCCTCCVFW